MLDILGQLDLHIKFLALVVIASRPISTLITMAKPYLLSATRVRDLLRHNAITVEEYARALLGRIEERDSIVKAWAFLGELRLVLLSLIIHVLM